MVVSALTAAAPSVALSGQAESEAAARLARGLGNDVAFGASRSYAWILRDPLATFDNVLLVVGGAVLVAAVVATRAVALRAMRRSRLVARFLDLGTAAPPSRQGKEQPHATT